MESVAQLGREPAPAFPAGSEVDTPTPVPEAAAELVAAAPTTGRGVDGPPVSRSALRQYTGTAADLRAVPEDAPREPATRGWRKGVRVLTGGLIAPQASAEELRERESRDLAASQWSRLMTVLVANPKGGTGKTPSTIGLAGAFGEVRGGGVLAWDNNETLGTLGIRTVEGRFPTTVVDLLHNIDEFETRAARRGDLGAFVRMQVDGKFEALTSDEDPSRMAIIGREEFNRIWSVVARFYQLLLIDTGNNPRAANFVAACERADQLVIPMQWSQDAVESGARLIDQLHRAGYGELVARAVVLVSHDGRSSRVSPATLARWREWYTRTCAGIYEIPFDTHIAERGPIRHSRLAAPTRLAYLHAAGGIATRLNHIDNRWEK